MIDALYALLKTVGFDEPLHSPITHMPIGLVVGALIFFLVALFFKRSQLVLSARHASILALVFVFPTILFGVFDWIHFYHGILMPAIRIKMFLAGGLLVLLGAGIMLGGAVKLRNVWMTVIYALSFVAVMGLGYFGAGIIYGRGISAPPAVQAGSVPGGGAGAGAGADAVAVQRGQAVFASNCQACHGNGGNAIDPSRPIKGSTKLASLEKFSSFVRNPAKSDGSAGEMPPFPADALPEAQVKDLFAYASSAWR